MADQILTMTWLDGFVYSWNKIIKFFQSEYLQSFLPAEWLALDRSWCLFALRIIGYWYWNELLYFTFYGENVLNYCYSICKEKVVCFAVPTNENE